MLQFEDFLLWVRKSINRFNSQELLFFFGLAIIQQTVLNCQGYSKKFFCGKIFRSLPLDNPSLLLCEAISRRKEKNDIRDFAETSACRLNDAINAVESSQSAETLYADSVWPRHRRVKGRREALAGVTGGRAPFCSSLCLSLLSQVLLIFLIRSSTVAL